MAYQPVCHVRLRSSEAFMTVFMVTPSSDPRLLLTATFDFANNFPPDTDDLQNKDLLRDHSGPNPDFSATNVALPSRSQGSAGSEEQKGWRGIEGGFCTPIRTLGRITDNCDQLAKEDVLCLKSKWMMRSTVRLIKF